MIVSCQYYLHVSIIPFHSGRQFYHSLWVSWDSSAKAQDGNDYCGAISCLELLCQIGHLFNFLSNIPAEGGQKTDSHQSQNHPSQQNNDGYVLVPVNELPVLDDCRDQQHQGGDNLRNELVGEIIAICCPWLHLCPIHTEDGMKRTLARKNLITPFTVIRDRPIPIYRYRYIGIG